MVKLDKNSITRLTNDFLKGAYFQVEDQISKILASSVNMVESTDLGYTYQLCYTYAGLVALERDNTDESLAYLKKSADRLDSPVLDMFGPNLLLAHKLSEQEYFNEVLNFIERFEDGLNGHFPSFTVRKWSSMLRAKDHPNFGKHIYMHLATNKDQYKRLEQYAKGLTS